MRKRLFTLLLMLCPLLIAGMASAGQQLYMIGNEPFGNGWDPANVKAMTLESDGVTNTFTGTATGTVYFAICTGSATDWNTMNSTLRYSPKAGNTNVGNDGGTFELNNGYEGTLVLPAGDWEISVNSETMVMTISRSTPAQDATISSVNINGASDSQWSNRIDFALTPVASANNTWEGTLDCTDITSNIEFKLCPNSEWIGVGGLTLNAPDNWISGTDNFILANSTTGYKTYKFTAVWEPSPNAATGWTLTVAGIDKREEPIVKTYTVAGTPDAIFGNVWDATNTANDMTENNGIYTFTKTGVELTAGDEIQFKVVENHSWDTAYGTAEGGNVIYKVNVTGSHDITITFDPAVGIPEITLTDDEAAAYDYTQHAYRICGTDLFGGWGATEGDATVNPMTLIDGKYVFTKTDVEITSALLTGQEYRIRVDDAYKTADDGDQFGINGIQNNMGLTFDKTGTYDITITFDPATATVSHELTRHAVPAKDYTVKVVNSGNWDAMNVFAWNDGGSITGAWPGTAATLSEEKAGEFSIYTYTFENLEEDAVPTQIIFNAGNNMPQTADLTFEDGKTYWAVTTYGIEGAAFGGWKDGSQYRGIERILTDQGNGIYTYTTDAVLTANTAYPYRVSVDGAWASIGIGGVDGNKEFTVDADGTYTLVATLNTNYEGDGARTLDVVATLKTEDTYTIVGEKDIVNGSASWNLTETANDMTENEGVWTLTVEGAKLETGKDYLFKMVKNHAWGEGQIPADDGNKFVAVEETAEYTITYTYDGTDLSYSATKTGEYTPEPVDGQELVSGDHKVVIKGVHYLNLTENNYVLTIKSEETMAGLGGSFWHTSAGDKDIRENMTVAEDGKTITVTATSTTDPQIYTPLYVMMQGEVNFGNVTIDWQEEGEVQNSVTFVNSRDWATVYAYTFDGDGEVLGAWPGTEMTKTDATVDGHDVYTIDITGAPQMIIFTAGQDGPQTPNYEFVNGKQYDYPEAKTYTAKFVNIPGWSSVNTYVYNGSVNNGWPGQAAAADGTKANVFGGEFDVYTATASLSVDPATIIFNNGEGTQTGNLPFVEGATYSWGSDITDGYFLFTDDANQFKPAQNYDVAGAKASYARKFTPGNVCTVVLPFAIGADVAAAAGKFYRITSIADGYIRGTEEIPAPYVPYIFIPATEYPFTNIGIGQLPAVQNSSITTGEGYTLQFVTETTELASDASYDYYGFSNGKFVKAAYATVNPFRSYIKVAKSANAPATLIWTDDEATGISSLKADIQNGKANVYDLQGRRVLNPVRGLYIVNGKKVIVK